MCSAWMIHAQIEPHVLHELTLKKKAEDAESDIAIRLVDEND